MDLRSLINKLDTIEQTKLLLESEQLMEKVRIRYSDVEAVAKQYATDDDARGKAIAKLAKDNGLNTLFDPISGELVNADGSYSTFKGADEATVERLKSWGLLPLNAKTSSWLGFRGQDRKTAIGDNQTAQGRDQMVDRAEELMKKAVTVGTSAVATKESIAESLLSSFGYTTALLEYITPEEHTELKGLVQKLTPFAKQDPDSADIVARFNAYNEKRNDLIARIKEIIAAIKPAATSAAPETVTKTATTSSAERSGSSANESLDNTNLEMLLELSLTPQGQKAGAKLFEPSATGYLNPTQVQHNLALLKKGHAKLDWNDHIGKTVKDWANMATFDMADKAAAYMSSVGDKNTSYEKERAKQKAIDQAYNQDPNALNLRTAANAAGVKIDPNNAVGNMTVGDVLGLVGPGAVSTVFNAGRKVAAKLGGGAVAKFVAGTGAVIGTQKAADAIDNIVEPGKVEPGKVEPVQTQPEKLKYDPEVQKIQDYLVKVYGSEKNILPRFGADGKLGKETIAAVDRAKKEGKLTPDGKIPGNTTADSRLPNGANGAHADATTTADPATATNASAALDPKVVQDNLKKLGITGNQINPEQLLALADSMGIKDGEEVSSDTSSGSTSNSSGSSTDSMMGQYPSSKTLASAGSNSSGGIVQGTTSTAESLELSRILSLSGLKEDDNLEEGGFDRVAGWVIDQMIAKGMSREASLAKLTPNASNRALHAEIKGAKALAARIEAQGKNAEKAVASGEKAVASGEKVVPKVADDAVAKLSADAAKGEGLLYQVGKLGGRFVRLIKNNKFLALLAALAALGIILYVANKDDPTKIDPTKIDPSKVDPVKPQPVDPKEEERKRQLLDLEKLLAQLYGGWPTDAETAETIKTAVAAGAKAPEGFKEGGVNTQPAASTSSSSSNGRIFGNDGHKMSAQDLAKASAK
jgi:hypothetical protein